MVQRKRISKLNNSTLRKIEKQAKEMAKLVVSMSHVAQVGHIGSALSIVDIIAALYFHTLHIDPSTINHPNRDRFILSKGHAAAALYAALYLRDIISKDDLESFASKDGGLCEHPEISDTGIEMTTGSLGFGLGFGVGVSLGLARSARDARTFVLMSDGECSEGSVWEAAMLASKLKLSSLTTIIDYNHWQCFGRTDEVTSLEPFTDKWRAFGWEVSRVDGHNISALCAELSRSSLQGLPRVIIADTIMGKGVSLLEDKLIGHYKVLSSAEYRQALDELG